MFALCGVFVQRFDPSIELTDSSPIHLDLNLVYHEVVTKTPWVII